MSMPPQPPRPPAPPMPPRSGSNAVVIVLLILGIIVVAGIFAVWMGLRVLSHSVHVSVSDGLNGKKEVSIQTPAGNVEVRKDSAITEARLGLPIYPGATPVNDDNAAAVSIGVLGHAHVGVVAGKFETPDPLYKVRNFYNRRLRGEVTKFTEHDPEGKMVFEMKSHDLDRIVTLHDQEGKTRIELVRVGASSDQAN